MVFILIFRLIVYKSSAHLCTFMPKKQKDDSICQSDYGSIHTGATGALSQLSCRPGNLNKSSAMSLHVCDSAPL